MKRSCQGFFIWMSPWPKNAASGCVLFGGTGQEFILTNSKPPEKCVSTNT